jgi:hypothetical protein
MKERTQKIQRYLNPVSQMHLIAEAPYKVLIGGRGFSKTFGNGLNQAKKIDLMPRSCGLFTSPTYSMIYTKTLIPMKAAWEQHLGYIEGIHYVVGKAPPKHFEKPWHKPQRYENVITFWNGRTIIFGSFDRAALISGGSYDDVDNDECYLIDKDDYDNFVIPTVRGTHPSFKDVTIHLQQCFTSSMPFKNQGDWLLGFYPKSKTNPKMYSFIGWEPNATVQKGSTWMNRIVLGDKAILQMKAEMNEHSYKIMILNQQVSSWGNTFYPALSAKHFYTPRANDKVVSLPIDKLNFKRDASFDESTDDYNPDMPLHISHDWGVFNCITIDQEYPKEIRFIKGMHVENPNTLDDLADEFADYYRMHRVKIVYQWGDSTGNNKQANSKLTYFEQFAERLRDKGWRVIKKKTEYIDHLERYRLIATIHKGEDKRFPIVRYNATNCADMRIALEATTMKDDKKDKSSERNQSIKPEHATHYTDAHDYRLYHALKKRESKDSYDPYSTSLT